MLARHQFLQPVLFSREKRVGTMRAVQGTRALQSSYIVKLKLTAASSRRRDALLVRFRSELSPETNADGINIPIEAQQVGA